MHLAIYSKGKDFIYIPCVIAVIGVSSLIETQVLAETIFHGNDSDP